MFDLKKLTQKQFRLLNIAVFVVYFALILFVPLLLVGLHYDLFKQTTQDDVGKSLSGWGLITLGIAGTAGLVALRKVIAKIPEGAIGSARLKYSLQFLTEMIAPALVIVILIFMKDDFVRAYECAQDIVVVFLVGAVYKWLLLSSVQREAVLRDRARESNEIEARKSVV